MNYKILRIKNFGFNLSNYHKNDPFKKYQDSLLDIESKKFIYCDGFSREMNKLGNSCFEIISKNEELQKKWANENEFQYDHNWHDDILIEQIKTIKPDILYFEDSIPFQKNFNYDIKDIFPFVKKIIVRNGNPKNIISFKNIDIIFTICEKLKKDYQKKNIQTFLVHHYFDDQILNKINKNEKNNQISFMGESGYLMGKNYVRRYQIIKTLLKNFDLNLFIFEKKNRNITEILMLYLKSYIKILINKFPLKKTKFSIYNNIKISDYLLTKQSIKTLFPKNVIEPLFGLNYYNFLNEILIFVNCHRLDVPSGNMKLFEVSGVGTAQITDYNDETNNLFKENDEILFYKTNDELVSKLKEIQKKPKFIKNIGKQAQKKILKYHTTKHRIQQIHNIITKLI